MINTVYANAYKEVLIVISNLVKEDYEKIPKEYIKFLKENCNNEYEFIYDTSKSFNEQELLDDTKYILFGLFEKYGATEIQKAKINAYKINYRNQLEKQKIEKYNSNDIFKNEQGKNVEENVIPTEMIVYKENIFKKLMIMIKRFFHK